MTNFVFSLPLEEDRVQGMLSCLALGDVLGVPHESRHSKLVFTGKLEHVTLSFSRFQGIRQLEVPPGTTCCGKGANLNNSGYPGQ